MTGDALRASGTHQVLIGGEAGQGVMLQGIILADAAAAAGAWVAQTARYGAAMRGGEATAGVIVSRRPIDFPYVEAPDSLVVLSQLTYDKYASSVAGLSLLVYDSFFVSARQQGGLRQVGIAATEASMRELGSVQPANLICVSALAELTGLVTTDDLVAAVDHHLPARFRDSNIRALELGRSLARAAEERP